MVHVSDVHTVVISYVIKKTHVLQWNNVIGNLTYCYLLFVCWNMHMFLGSHIKIALHQENWLKKYRMCSMCVR